MKKKRWGISVLLISLILTLCSCKGAISDVIDSFISDTAPSSSEESAEPNEYKEIFAAYKASNEEYYKKTESAINTIIGQKYGYGITAYDHSDDLAEIAEMFFDSNSEAVLDVYFKIRGYENGVYTENGNTAEYSAKKKNDECVYKTSYDAERRCFEIVYTVNGEIKDNLKCELGENTLMKCCYSGTIDRTFISRVNSDGESTVEWFDRKITDPCETEANEERGSVVFDGEKLSGVIK